MLTSIDTVFSPDTCAHLVVGRGRDLTGVTASQFREACQRLDRWAAAHGVAVGLIASGDFSGATGPAGGDELTGTCVLGIPVLTVDDALGSWEVDPEVVDAAVARARRLRWDDLAALLPGPRMSDVGVYTAATGPRSGVVLAYGVPVDGTDQRGLGTSRPELTFVAARDTNHDRRSPRVYGIEIVGRTYRSGPTELIDLSPAARQRHRTRLGTLADRSTYHLMSHYDH